MGKIVFQDIDLHIWPLNWLTCMRH